MRNCTQNPNQTTLDFTKSGALSHAILAATPKGGALISPLGVPTSGLPLKHGAENLVPASGLPLKGGAKMREMPDRAEGGRFAQNYKPNFHALQQLGQLGRVKIDG